MIEADDQKLNDRLGAKGVTQERHPRDALDNRIVTAKFRTLLFIYISACETMNQ